MTEASIDHNDVDAALRRCGSDWDAAQAHGLLCGLIVTLGTEGAVRWLNRVLSGTDPDDALAAECRSLLESLCQATWQQLAERQSEFELLLPLDAEDAAIRASAMGHWCEGFLHGLVSERGSMELRKRLAEEPLADVIRDLLEITRAGVADDDDEANEEAYTELTEYIRVAVQLAFEELTDLRTARNPVAAAVSDALH
ncbi:MAG: UPF0149 family protein [Gammaproteobacteria bacterium]|nr:UPF0149 family protein [Gammaproteobacteria bacterium]MDH4253826.1 UPF0149 family protein [Gammaproteobacteria bacterium]MDH5311048.1 UPF0149 family protein [Gammaproteobacteria bacterium]